MIAAEADVGAWMEFRAALAHEDFAAVDGLAATLQAEVSRDGVTKTIPFVPMGNGEYEAPFVPTASSTSSSTSSPPTRTSC